MPRRRGDVDGQTECVARRYVPEVGFFDGVRFPGSFEGSVAHLDVISVWFLIKGGTYVPPTTAISSCGAGRTR